MSVIAGTKGKSMTHSLIGATQFDAAIVGEIIACGTAMAIQFYEFAYSKRPALAAVTRRGRNQS